MNNYTYIILILSAILVLSSCSKKEEEPDSKAYWLAHKNEKIDQIEKYGPKHDDYFMLQDIGTEDDLKYLIYGLLQFDDTNRVCTRSHCLAALRKISGADLGNKSDDWLVWWENKYNQKLTWHPHLKWDMDRGEYVVYKTTSNQQVEPIVKSPVDEVEAQSTQAHP